MALLTDTDIEKRLGADIVISPYQEKNLTPVGYDITVGSFVYLLGGSILQADERGIYEIPARSTVLIWSNECIFVSNRTAGLLRKQCFAGIISYFHDNRPKLGWHFPGRGIQSHGSSHTHPKR